MCINNLVLFIYNGIWKVDNLVLVSSAIDKERACYMDYDTANAILFSVVALLRNCQYDER